MTAFSNGAINYECLYFRADFHYLHFSKNTNDELCLPKGVRLVVVSIEEIPRAIPDEPPDTKNILLLIKVGKPYIPSLGSIQSFRL